MMGEEMELEKVSPATIYSNNGRSSTGSTADKHENKSYDNHYKDAC